MLERYLDEKILRSAKDLEIWDAYNTLLLGPDCDRLRKILIRAELLRKALRVPGDVVECGVLKGAGLFTWGKLLEIFGFRRRVIGFDVFDGFAGQETESENAQVQRLVRETKFQGVDTRWLESLAEAAGLRVELVSGPIEETAREYAESNPNRRIALLNLDLDFYAPTKAALEHLWPLVTPGGVVVFDEYGVPEFTESRAVDEFVATNGGEILSTKRWAKSPTAYLVKRA